MGGQNTTSVINGGMHCQHLLIAGKVSQQKTHVYCFYLQEQYPVFDIHAYSAKFITEFQEHEKNASKYYESLSTCMSTM